MTRPDPRAAGALALAIALGGCTAIETTRARFVKTEPRCEARSVAIYFEPGSAELTEDGKSVIRQAAIEARGCSVDRVEVLGLADAAGTPDANLELSNRRAQAVTAALATAGLPAAEFRVAGGGQEGAVTDTGAAQPLRRRAEVVLQLSPPKTAP